ncbi:MAG: primosomal protein N' [Christensenella sp.]|uniref:replication restart helicase PriA n=1 Tax=Christensenella sp. TaxID=1935934 RepID=UPI002B1F8A74|nr:primosomal protein N' [Christensenella sp.]MEA5002451.1 primosomal protein N' [Christensenella sp.]
MYAKVIVDISHTQVDRVFEYLIPQELHIEPGMRVSVPFGKSKMMEGIVIGLAQTPEFQPEKIKPILSTLEDFCALTQEQIDLACFIKDKYNTTLASALRFMIPSQLRGAKVGAKTQNMVSLIVSGEELREAKRALYKQNGEVKFPKQLEVLNKLKMEGQQPASELNASAVKSLVRKGLVATEKEEVLRTPFKHAVELIEDYTLTDTQQEILDTIRTSGEKSFLLHGATGSGKTEIYIRVIRDALEKGKTALMLVPEISLTPQTYKFLKQRFAEKVAVFHSGLSAGERYDEWMKVKRGQARIVLGARSAVFAPLENLGVVIIDEEHETSYKADNYPKYTAHEIAKKRCDMNDAILILGSATPQIETYYRACQGEMHILKMPQRLFDLALPSVEIVDLRRELSDGNRTAISGSLYEALNDTLAQGKQAMLFLNRRGYSTFVMCRSCGYVVKCDSCDVTMTYHKSQDMLKCHYCGRTKTPESMCPKCGKPHLKYFGVGTQQIEEQLREMFPQARLLRMDMDTTGTKDAHLKIFEQFAAHKADILIGTQMITKGLDFERVTLSAILAADTMLNIPDYRSAERTFSHITQIAGRAGRKEAGKVILQTYNPDHYAVQYASKHDYDGFYRYEIKMREMAMLPPFSTYVQIQFSGEKNEQVVAAVKEFIRQLKTVILPHKHGIISIRAAEAAIRRIRNMERYNILIHLKNGEEDLIHSIYQVFNRFHYQNVLAGIDINPVNMA